MSDKSQINMRKVHLNRIADITRAMDKDEMEVILRNIPNHMLELELERRSAVMNDKISKIVSVLSSASAESLDETIMIIKTIRGIVK